MGAQIWQLLAVRLVQAFLVVLVVTSLVFLLSRTTGDPLRSLTRPGARIEVIERQRESLGLNDPLIVQYGRYLGAAVQGDFGTSFRSAQPPMDDVRRRIWPTAQLGLAAFGFSLAVGISVGVLSAVRRGSAIDLLARILALIGQATPSFWMGLMLIFLFAVELGLLPTGGRGGAKNLILPAVTLGSFGAAATLRLTRSSMLEVLDSDFIRTARAKGLRESAVIRRHALRNALFPVVTVLGLQMASLLSGTIIIETVFAWPGLGRLMIDSIRTADFPVVSAAVVVTTGWLALVNVAVDVSYACLDPRVRTSAL